jgi:hypothetical protein
MCTPLLLPLVYIYPSTFALSGNLDIYAPMYIQTYRDICTYVRETLQIHTYTYEPIRTGAASRSIVLLVAVARDSKA